MNQSSSLTIRQPHDGEVEQLGALIGNFAAQNVMLPRNITEIRATLPDWLVAIEEEGAAKEEERERIVGCGSLVPLTEQLVEIRSLAVDASQQGKGVGGRLVIDLVEMARERGYARVCALTLRERFFQRLGFELVDRWSISPKVWQACIYCAKFHRCDEVAVVLEIEAAVQATSSPMEATWRALLKHKAWQPLRLAYQNAESYDSAHSIKPTKKKVAER